jgi:hypothetical protein
MVCEFVFRIDFSRTMERQGGTAWRACDVLTSLLDRAEACDID